MIKKVFVLVVILITMLLFLNTPTFYTQQNHQNQNNLETRIEIKIDGKINELLNYFKNQNPRLKIESKVKGEKPEKENREIEGRESKVEKYHFIPITISALSIIFVLWLFITIKKEKKYGINLVNNIFMSLIFLLSALSGILLIYDYKIQGFDLKFWHVIVSIILLFVIIFHIVTHWHTWLSYFKKIFRIKG